tara:strand:+ start:196 stop:1731 length:1536 start_codon:yes stop_codon:yes gene_type:complete
MASTYESPETVVISEAAPIVAAIGSIGKAFTTSLDTYTKVKNAEAIANRKRQAALVSSIAGDPNKFYKDALKYDTEDPLLRQLDQRVNGITRIKMAGMNGTYDGNAVADIGKLQQESYQILTYAKGQKDEIENWRETYLEKVQNGSNQGGASFLDKNLWNAYNAMSGDKGSGSYEFSFEDGAAFYTFTGPAFEEEYKVPAGSFLSSRIPLIPEFDKSIKTSAQGVSELMDKDGGLSIRARKMSEDEFNTSFDNMAAQRIATESKISANNASISNVEVFGGEKIYKEGAGTPPLKGIITLKAREEGQDDIIIDVKDMFAGSAISAEDQRDMLYNGIMYSRRVLRPKHYGIDPKPIPAREKALTRKIAKYKKDSNTWKETFEEKKSLFGFGKNPEGGAYTGSIDMFKDTQEKDENGNLVNVLEPNFIKALSEIGPGYRVVSTTGSSGGTEVTVSRTNNKGGTVTFVEGSTAQNFIDKLYNYEFEGDEGYGPEQAKAFANQFIKDGGIKPQLPY